MDTDVITGQIVDVAYHIHRELGPGLLESVYLKVFAHRLRGRGFVVETQKVISFEFDGILFESGLRVDMLVEGRVVVELKSVEKTAPVHWKQTLTYLRLLKLPVGLLLNFGCATMKEGITRVVNHHVPTDQSPLEINQPTPPMGGGPAPS